jgi:hypothetical protein
MIKLRFPMVYFTMLFVAGYMLHADFVFSADQAAPMCMTPCEVEYKACFDKVKDSPNDIEREVCSDAKKECVAKCAAEIQEYAKEQEDNELEKQEEKARLEQEEKARLGQFDLTPEEQQKGLKTWKRERRVEERENEEQEQDVPPLQEQQAAPPQEQQDGETLNGIKIYQFK